MSRTEATAKISEIKAEPYTVDAVKDLLHSFESAAGLALLFLKNVRTISLHVKRSGGGPVELLKKISMQSEVCLRDAHPMQHL